MISSLGGQADQFLASLNQIQERASQVSLQITSGLKVNQPSDAPQDVTDILLLRADIDRAKQVQSNLSGALNEVNTGESALRSAVSALESAITTGAQGANSTATAADRQSLAVQVQAIQEQLVSISQTNVGGHYVFSGDHDLAPAYQLDLSSPTGVTRQFPIINTRQIADATGATFSIWRSAQQIFDNRNADDTPASNNVFQAVNSLRLALLNNDQPGVVQALSSLHEADDYLNSQLASYGVVQDRIAAAQDQAAKYQIQQTSSLSDRQDTDITAAALELTQVQTNLQAAMSAQAKLPKTSLFDFLG